MGINRRSFLKVLGAGIAAGGVAGAASGGIVIPGKPDAQDAASAGEFVGILVDTTRCVGCRSCEAACAEAHKLPTRIIGQFGF